MTEQAAMAVVLAMAVIIALTSALAPLCRLLKQPVVVGQLVAGLGLGLLPRGLAGAVIPAASLPFLTVVSQVGLVLFLFRVGYEIDPRTQRGHWPSIAAVAGGAFALPMLLGGGLPLLLGGSAPWAARLTAPPGVNRGSFILFMAVALSITAVPVLACILRENELVLTRPGIVAMASAGLIDVVGWLLLTIAVASAGIREPAAGTVVLLLLGYLLAMLLLARPALSWLLTTPRGAARFQPEMVAIPFALASAWCTAKLGLHPFFGALLAGVLMPRQPEGRPDPGLLATIDGAGSVLLPVFFVVTGMSVRIGALTGSDLWLLGVVCAVAVAGKLGGSTLAARASRMPWRDSAVVGVLMDTRGLTELIAINAGRQAGLIGTSLYTVLVLMALATTMLTGPLLALLRATAKPGIAYQPPGKYVRAGHENMHAG